MSSAGRANIERGSNLHANLRPELAEGILSSIGSERWARWLVSLSFQSVLLEYDRYSRWLD